MGTNKKVSVVLLDVCQAMDSTSDNGESYFTRSLECLKRMILRKMFSQDNDELGIILMGSDITNNPLARASHYEYINVFSEVGLCSWDLYRRVEDIKLSHRYSSDWLKSLVVAVDFLKSETQGRRFRTKQIIIFSNCSGDIYSSDDSMSSILNVLEGENVQLIVVGNDVEEEYSQGKEVSESLQMLFNTVTKLESGVHYSLSEIEKDLEYFEKKRKMCRLLKVNLVIGSGIQMPVRWMKVTSEETRFKWDIPPSHFAKRYENEARALSSASGQPKVKEEMDVAFENESSTYTKVEYTTDISKKTNFGASLIELSYADLEALKRKTGPASFTYIGSVRRSKIPRSMFVGKDIYVVVPDKDARSVCMFSAFVDALIEAKKYAIARRIPVKNGKITIGALLPVSDNQGKALYYMKLPFAEWVRRVPEVEFFARPKREEALAAMESFIESSLLPEDLLEEGKGLLVRDPTFQARCHILTAKALGRLSGSEEILTLPEQVVRILKPTTATKDTNSEEDSSLLERIDKLFPREVEQKISHDSRKESIVKNSKDPPIKVEKREETVEELLKFSSQDHSEDILGA